LNTPSAQPKTGYSSTDFPVTHIALHTYRPERAHPFFGRAPCLLPQRCQPSRRQRQLNWDVQDVDGTMMIEPTSMPVGQKQKIPPPKR